MMQVGNQYRVEGVETSKGRKKRDTKYDERII